MDVIIIFFVLSCISLAVPKFLFLDVVTMKGILFIAVMYTVSVTFW